jgi:hypothetical protein
MADETDEGKLEDAAPATINVESLLTDKEPAGKQTAQPADKQGATDATDWKKLYSDSSREAKRLVAERKALEAEKTAIEERFNKFKPLIDVAENDPRFIQHIKTYFETGGSRQPAKENARTLSDYGMESVEDFNMTEALANPNSPSGRLFNDVVASRAAELAGKVVDDRMRSFEDRYRQSEALKEEQRQRDTYLTTHPGMTAEDYDAVINWSKSEKITVDDIFALHALKTGKKTAKQTPTVDDILAQAGVVRRAPTTLAGVGSDGKTKDTTDELWEAVKKNAPLRLS